MRNYLAVFLVCTASLLPLASSAAENSSKSEDQPLLLWNGKEIPPLCFDKLLGPEAVEKVDIATCEKNDAIKNIKTLRTKDSFLETSYQYAEEGESFSPPYMSYRVVGKQGSDVVVETAWRSGGSGRFSEVLIVQIEGETLVVKKIIWGGDRCNGGILDAEIKDEKIHATINITPADFPVIAYGEDRGIEAYADLEAGAASCFATVTYAGDDVSKVTLSVDFPWDGSKEWVSRYKYQACFNQTFSKQIKEKSELSLVEFRSFVDKFFKDCVSQTK